MPTLLETVTHDCGLAFGAVALVTCCAGNGPHHGADEVELRILGQVCSLCIEGRAHCLGERVGVGAPLLMVSAVPGELGPDVGEQGSGCGDEGIVCDGVDGSAVVAKSGTVRCARIG